MTPERIEALKAWLTAYVAPFYTGDEAEDYPIRLKERHTRNVGENCVRVARKIGLNGGEQRLAESIGLFHDLGRFKQYKQYKTFKDNRSLNHAMLSIREMTGNRLLDGLDVRTRQTIVRAVAFHNLPTLPGGEPEDRARFQKIVRDADKIDIWRVFAEHYVDRARRPNQIIEMNVPDIPEWSPAAVDAFRESRVVRVADIETLNDLKLFQLSWVYDLNFRASFELAMAQGNLKAIADSLPDADETRWAVNTALERVVSVLSGPVEHISVGSVL